MLHDDGTTVFQGKPKGGIPKLPRLQNLIPGAQIWSSAAAGAPFVVKFADEHTTPGPLWRPAGSYIESTTFTSQNKSKRVLALRSHECFEYATPRLPGEGDLASALASSRFAGYKQVRGCGNGGCARYTAPNNTMGVLSLLVDNQTRTPVWINGFAVYTGQVWVSFQVVAYLPLHASAAPPRPV